MTGKTISTLTQRERTWLESPVLRNTLLTRKVEETAKERNGAKQENSATLQAAYPSDSISGSVSSHFQETVQKSFKLSVAQGECPQEELAPR